MLLVLVPLVDRLIEDLRTRVPQAGRGLGALRSVQRLVQPLYLVSLVTAHGRKLAVVTLYFLDGVLLEETS